VHAINGNSTDNMSKTIKKVSDEIELIIFYNSLAKIKDIPLGINRNAKKSF